MSDLPPDPFIISGLELERLRSRIEALEAALRFLFEETKWKSVDKDNMEFEGRVTCYQLDKARAALAPERSIREMHEDTFKYLEQDK